MSIKYSFVPPTSTYTLHNYIDKVILLVHSSVENEGSILNYRIKIHTQRVHYGQTTLK